MSKTLRTVAMIAGAVALVATGVGAAAGVGVFGAAGAGATAATVAGVSVGTISTIASAATVVSVAASIGAQLTAKKPSAQGSITEVTVMVDPPQPYLMGRSYSAGILRHDTGYGPEIDKVKNPYMGKVIVYSGSGPVQEIESVQFDYAPVSFTSGWYGGWGGVDTQLGLTPEPTALAPIYPPMPDWGAAYKLSGQAAVLWNFRFDKKAKRYASGIPPYGAVIKGVKVYDARLDSTYPGGSGPCRLGDESTYVYSENPGCHAVTYIYGRYQNGKKVFGIGMPVEGIDMARYVELSNVCDLNNWKVGGSTFEPGDRWENLKDILAAGGSEPIFAGGKLSCMVQAPKIAIDTVYEQDLADADMEVTTAQSYRDRMNGVIPKFRSEENNWQYVSVETVSVPEYIAEDGEEKFQETQFNLVQQATQAAQLAAYELVDGREMGPITITLKPYWRRYMPGECVHLYLPAMELDHDAIILTRELNPDDLTVTLTLVTETAGKHAFALGQTRVPPAPPTLTSPEDRDDALANEYVAHLPDLVNETGELLEDVVTTQSIVPGAVSASQSVSAPGVTIPANTIVSVLATGWIDVGSAEFSETTFNINFTLNADLAGEYDASARFSLYIDIDDGAGFVLDKQQTLGVATVDGDSYGRFSGQIQAVITAPRFRVNLHCHPNGWLQGSVARDVRVEDIISTVIGLKR